MTDFIKIYENAFSKEYCEKAIKYFNFMDECKFTFTRQETEDAARTKKEDTSLIGHKSHLFELDFNKCGDLFLEFNAKLWADFYPKYAEEFAVLKESDKHYSFVYKIQKTPIGGGYHIWHYETSNRERCNRLLAWALYLNDVEEGGETEFLYQHKRIKAKQGTFVLFPASFTHTHRGNPPISNDKYIVTGWIEF